MQYAHALLHVDNHAKGSRISGRHITRCCASCFLDDSVRLREQEARLGCFDGPLKLGLFPNNRLQLQLQICNFGALLGTLFLKIWL